MLSLKEKETLSLGQDLSSIKYAVEGNYQTCILCLILMRSYIVFK